MSKSKGAGGIGLAVIVAVIVVGIMLIFGIQSIMAEIKIKAKVTYKISFETDDRGTEVISLLKSKTSEKNYMQLLGETKAANHEQFIGDKIEEIRRTLSKIEAITKKNYFINILGAGFSYGNSSEVKLDKVDIPLPGGSRTFMEVST